MRKTADLTGKRFGKLTVIEKTGEQEDRYWTWRCKCDCGKEIVVNTKRLTRGTVSHCGCEKKNAASLGPIPDDLTGKRYGKLTVLRLDKYRDNGKSSWFCQCDCGNQCVVTAYSLHYKKRKSCGCLHRETDVGQETDLRNKVFGKLTALYPTEQQDRNGSVLWRCRCECGNTVNVSQDSLLQGHYRSCGCVRQELQNNLYENLTFVDNTCVEVLERRKSSRTIRAAFAAYPKDRTANGLSQSDCKASVTMWGCTLSLMTPSKQDYILKKPCTTALWKRTRPGIVRPQITSPGQMRIRSILM